MSSDLWKKARLGEISDVVMGQSPKSEYYNNTGEGLPFLQGNRSFGDKYPLFDTYCTNGNKFANPDDVLLSVRAPVGDLNITKERVCIGRGLASLCMKNGNNEYLYYLLKANIDELINRQSGTVYGSINRNDIFNFEVLVLDSDEKQLEVSDILSTLDDKIELNRQTNATLEAIAQAIFKEWFVDFNYPGATGELVDSELGPIPKGWSIGQVDDIVDLQPGFSFKSREFVPAGKFRLITIKNVQDGILSLTNTNYLNEIPSSMPDYCFLNEGDILISLTGNVGRVCFIYVKDLLLNQRVAKLNPRERMLWSFTYSLFRNSAVKADLIELSKGTAQLNLSIVETKQKSIMIPTKELLLQYDLVTSDIFKKFIDNFKEQNLLTLLRDILLPKLMSGEIEI